VRQVVLQRAQAAGHDLDALLSSPAVRTTLPGHGPAALHVADAITGLLVDHPTPALVGLGARGRNGITSAWNHLPWALKAAEDRGADPCELLPAAGADTSLDQRQRYLSPIVSAWRHPFGHRTGACGSVVVGTFVGVVGGRRMVCWLGGCVADRR